MRRDTIERKARHLINQIGIGTPPVNVQMIAEHLGIQLREMELPEGVSGVLERNATGKSTILVNQAHPDVRRRFTTAHEIGHFCLSSKLGVIIDRAIYFRDSRSQTAVDFDEIAANTFAAELLMPTQMVKQAIGEVIHDGRLSADDDVVQILAKQFEVSATAMSVKLQNLGFRFTIA